MRPRRAFRRARLRWLCLCLLVLGAGRIAAAQDLASAIKAAYLVKFTGFVDWPPAAFAGIDSPFVLCLAGAGSLEGLVKQAAAGATVGRHPIEIRSMPVMTRASGCNMLYAAGPAIESALASSEGEPILTVTDAPAGAAERGIINFVIRDNRVRFAIDPRAAAASGLRISSQLLALAVDLR